MFSHAPLHAGHIVRRGLILHSSEYEQPLPMRKAGCVLWRDGRQPAAPLRQLRARAQRRRPWTGTLGRRGFPVEPGGVVRARQVRAGAAAGAQAHVGERHVLVDLLVAVPCVCAHPTTSVWPPLDFHTGTNLWYAHAEPATLLLQMHARSRLLNSSAGWCQQTVHLQCQARLPGEQMIRAAVSPRKHRQHTPEQGVPPCGLAGQQPSYSIKD